MSQIVPALFSLLLPGVGQLLQGRTETALKLFGLWLLAILLCAVACGFLLVPCVHIYAAIEAARWQPKEGA